MSFIQKKQRYYASTFDGVEGKYVLASILDASGFYKTSFSPDNPHQTSYNEGKRAIALGLIQILGLSENDIRELVRSYREDVAAAEVSQQQFMHKI